MIQFPVSPLVYIRKARREEQQSFITCAIRKHALERRYSEFVEYVGTCEAQKMFAAGKSVAFCLQVGFRIMDRAAGKAAEWEAVK